MYTASYWLASRVIKISIFGSDPSSYDTAVDATAEEWCDLMRQSANFSRADCEVRSRLFNSDMISVYLIRLELCWCSVLLLNRQFGRQSNLNRNLSILVFEVHWCNRILYSWYTVIESNLLIASLYGSVHFRIDIIGRYIYLFHVVNSLLRRHKICAWRTWLRNCWIAANRQFPQLVWRAPVSVDKLSEQSDLAAAGRAAARHCGLCERQLGYADNRRIDSV